MLTERESFLYLIAVPEEDLSQAIEDALDRRRKRLRYRSWHRGTRESDLIFGRFADAHLGAMTAEQLDRYAALLENSDPDLYNWVAGRVPVPAAFDHDVMKLLKSFKVHEARS